MQCIVKTNKKRSLSQMNSSQVGPNNGGDKLSQNKGIKKGKLNNSEQIMKG